MHKIRVGVLMGGRSIEREVSFNSGRTVCDHLDVARYDVVPIFQDSDGTLFLLPAHFLHRGKITDFQDRLLDEATVITWQSLPTRIDFMYSIMHGRYAEDGIVQGCMELLGIPYLGSKVFASAVSMDKSMQKTILASHNIAVPRGFEVHPDQLGLIEKDSDYLHSVFAERIGSFPCIVKPNGEGSSLGVQVVDSFESLFTAILHAMQIEPGQLQQVLVEEKVTGMEFSCITLTDYKTGKYISLPPTEIVIDSDVGFFDYEQKYMPGRAHKFTPARCSQEVIEQIQKTCISVMDALGMSNFSRIDGFVTNDNRVIIFDPNTLSGMGPSSFLFREAAEIDMSHTQVINHLIETELYRYGMLDAVIEREAVMMNEKNIEKKRVVVLMGGDSNEREISLESGRNITYKLSPQRYDAIPVFVDSNFQLFRLNQSLLVRNSTSEIASCVTGDMKISWDDLPKIADFVFIGLHGGKGENGVVQGMLEMLDMPYNGSSVLASSLCMDKYRTNNYLKASGFFVPQSCRVQISDFQSNSIACIDSVCTQLSFPVIVKPIDDGCSMLVHKIDSKEQLVLAMQELFDGGKSAALIEEYVLGMELTVGVIGNEEPMVLTPSQAVSHGDILSIQEKFLPGAGENKTPAPLPADALSLVQKIVGQVYKKVGCVGYARIDCFYQSADVSPTGVERVVILEINTLPGMTPATCIFHQAAEQGIKPMDFIDIIIQYGFAAHQKQIMMRSDSAKVREDRFISEK